MTRRSALVVAACFLLTVSCASKPSLKPGEGFIDVPGGKVWYRIVGTGTRTPVLLLHGGPGVPSYYLEPLAALGDDRPVVFYDQLGAGRSERPHDPSLWQTERFVKELAEVRRALGLTDIHLYGHSWGTMLAGEYMRTQPTGVRSVVFASPALSIPRWLADAARLRSELPADVQQVLTENELAGTTASEAYKNATMEYYKRHVWRSDPTPKEVEASFAGIGQEVYETMWGPSEFYATGSLKTFDVTPHLGHITVPVLFTAGRFDEATPDTTAYYQSLVPGSQLIIFEHSAHMTMLDERDAYVVAIRQFLRAHDGS